MSDDAPEITANPGYAAHQIARALATSREHAEPAARERAVARAERWKRILEGMVRGTIEVGSRTPVAGLPPWVTLEVAKGGFTTGEALAGGALAAHEIALAGE